MRQYAIRYRRTAFTLVEILIVVGILGILAAITLPSIQGHIAKAKEATAKDSLRTVRQAIERYANDHNGVPPGYINNDPDAAVSQNSFLIPLIKAVPPYMTGSLENPFNKQLDIKMIQNGEPFPETPTGDFGWIYKPQTKEIRIDWPGIDSSGTPYFNY